MRHLAIIGSGPAGYYTAEAAQKAFGDDVKVDIFDTLPVPYGLIRFGVAPDHQSIKGVARRYEKVALSDNVRFVGHVTVGQDVTMEEMAALYDAVILATGAPRDRALDIPGEDLGNVFGSASFVGWYNGHPQFAGLDPDLSGENAVIIGMGNVALDVARILSKTDKEFEGSDIVDHALRSLSGSGIRRIYILGRRGPHQIQMTAKELGELGALQQAAPHVSAGDLPAPESDAGLDAGLRKSLGHLRNFAAIGNSGDKRIAIEFVFNVGSVSLIGNEKVREIEVERTELVDGHAQGTGETRRIPADLVVKCIGYRSVPIPGVPFDEESGRIANQDGRVSPGVYCVGWARRGPTGTIGTNRPDGYAIVEKIAEDIASGVLGAEKKPGREGFDALAAERKLDIVTFRDWKKIEEAEEHAARTGAPREKFIDIDAMIQARG